MSEKFRVAYLVEPPHGQFLADMSKAPEVEVLKIEIKNLSGEEILAQMATCHGYYCHAARDELPKEWHVTKELLSKLPKLLLVSSYGAGYDTVDPAACTASGVALCNQAGGNAEGVAEHAIGMMLCLLKRMPEADAAVRAGNAARREAFMGRELFGRTVGIVGLGHIGKRTAELARAFNCRVLTYDPYLSAEQCSALGAEKVSFEELLASSDVVSVHCPLNDETRNMFDRSTIARMRDGAIFVSTARGGIHDEDALFNALQAGKIGGAGLDVWLKEPPHTDHKLLTHPAVIASSHTAGVTHESRTRVAAMAAETFICAARGIIPPRIVNEAVTPTFERRLSKAFSPLAAE
jgi:D-3-phosphoglycerate dehydrogenase